MSSDTAIASGSTFPYIVGNRYLHAKNKAPLTLHYIGTLPPNSNDAQIWLGIEYDDASHGKHSGTFKDASVFQTRQPGAGAFVKYVPGARPLLLGETVITAIEDRYGALIEGLEPPEGGSGAKHEEEEAVVLGSSNAAIVVEAPNMDRVRKKIRSLERLREVGLEGQSISSLGGDDERRSVLRKRLKGELFKLVAELMSGVTTLDLSRNVIADWATVAEIVSHFTGLTTLVLNHSRIAPLSNSGSLPADVQGSFGGVTELHLGDCALNWDEAVRIGGLFPNLATLFLNNNPITETTHDQAASSFAHLTSLSLDACPLPTWDAVAGLALLPRLESLNLSCTPIKSIPKPSVPFPHLTRLTLTDTSVTHWASIDHLAQWAKLEVLRLSCAEATEMTPEAVLKHDPTTLSGDPRVDRPFLIAKLEHLTMLNGGTVTSAERWDAELYYIHFVAAIPGGNPDSWGRYGELVAKHGKGPKQTAKGPQTLKSKLLGVTVIPPSGHSFALRALPSMTIEMLRKKISVRLKKQPDELTLWTSFEHSDLDGFWERGEAMDTGREVGWYLTEGDRVLISMDDA